MRLVHASATAVTLAIALSTLVGAQGAQTAQDEKDRAIAGGGITAPGWKGTVDAAAVTAGMKITDGKFAAEAGGFRILTGPAANYWNPANTASGDYTVSAKFTEPKFQNVNDHPHPYGVFIAGNKMGTPGENLLYCAAYGTGTYIVRGFGPAPFQMGGRRPTASEAVHKAAGIGQPVDQTIALSVKAGRVECSINGTVVAGFDKAELVAAGKLDALDGVYGIRAAHNTEFMVTGLAKK
jgi:hypothetical protein